MQLKGLRHGNQDLSQVDLNSVFFFLHLIRLRHSSLVHCKHVMIHNSCEIQYLTDYFLLLI